MPNNNILILDTVKSFNSRTAHHYIFGGILQIIICNYKNRLFKDAFKIAYINVYYMECLTLRLRNV